MTAHRPPPEARLQGARVLVAEGEPLVRMALEFALGRAGCEVVAPATEADALAAVASGALDAAVVDLRLGWGAASWALAARLAEAGVPFVFTTGYDPASLPREVRARPLLSKPFRDAELLAALEALLADGQRRAG